MNVIKGNWGFIKQLGSVLAVVLPIGVGFYQFVLSDGAKRNIVITEEWRLTSVSLLKDLDARAELKIDGKSVNNISIADYSIENVGLKEILESDFHEPLRIEVNEPWELIGVTTDFSRPQGVNLKWTKVDEKTQELEPMLINPKDRFRLSVYVTNTMFDSNAKEQEKPSFSWPHRIRNLHEIQIKQREDTASKFWISIYFKNIGAVLFILIAGVLSTITSYLVLSAIKNQQTDLKRILVIVSVGMLSMVSATIITGNIVGNNMAIYNHWSIWFLCVLHFIVFMLSGIGFISNRSSTE